MRNLWEGWSKTLWGCLLEPSRFTQKYCIDPFDGRLRVRPDLRKVGDEDLSLRRRNK